MCMMAYIAADSPLEFIRWDENRPAFCVTELTEDDISVKKQFTKPFVGYLGAQTGCSCGFTYSEDQLLLENNDDDRKEYAQSQESVRRLSEYLHGLVEFGSVEIFASWDGDQESEPIERLDVTPEYFGGAEFAFGEKQFLVVMKTK